jgi:cephalosporin hydroxylase
MAIKKVMISIQVRMQWLLCLKRLNFILDGTKHGGAQVTYAKKAMEIGPDISQEGNSSRRRRSTVDVYAYGIRDVHDKKKAVKDMRFFSTGGRDNETACVWVAMEKNKANIHKNILFSNTKASSARAFVETELLLNCRSLTVKDKTADLFVLRRF